MEALKKKIRDLTGAKPGAGKADASKKAKPPTHTIRKEPFKIVVKLPGVFEAEKAVEVALRPKTWSQFKVTWAIPHGTRVKKGERVVDLDPEKLDEAIRDIEAGRALADLGHKLMQKNLDLLDDDTPLKLKSAERAQR